VNLLLINRQTPSKHKQLKPEKKDNH